MEDKVQCQICKKRFKWITPTHLKMHGLTFQEYKSLYPDAEMMASDVLAKRLEAAKRRRLTPEQKHRCGNGARGRVQSEEEKENRRQSCILAYTPEINKRRSETLKATLADGSVVARTNKTKDQRQFLIRFFREMRILEQAAYGNLIRCEICGEYRENVGSSHLKSHGITLAEYKRLYPLAKTTTEKYIKKLSLSTLGIPKPRSKEAARKGGETTKIKSALRYFIGMRDKVDGLLCGDLVQCEICGEIMGQLSKHLVFYHDITVEQYKKMYPGTLTISPNISKVLADENTKKWEDPDYKKKVSKTISGVISDLWDNGHYVGKVPSQESPNGLERKVISIIDNNKLPFKFVGDWSFMLGSKCPDFVHVGSSKKLIEVFGDYWHKGEDIGIREDYFSKYGYEMLVIWEHEVNENPDEVLIKIQEFSDQ